MNSSSLDERLPLASRKKRARLFLYLRELRVAHNYQHDINLAGDPIPREKNQGPESYFSKVSGWTRFDRKKGLGKEGTMRGEGEFLAKKKWNGKKGMERISGGGDREVDRPRDGPGRAGGSRCGDVSTREAGRLPFSINANTAAKIISVSSAKKLTTDLSSYAFARVRKTT